MKHHTLTVRMKREDFLKLRMIALSQDRDVSKVVRKIIKKYIGDHNEQRTNNKK